MSESVTDLCDSSEILVRIGNATPAGDDGGTVDSESNWRRMPLGELAEAPPIHLEFQGRMASKVRVFF